MVVLTIHMLFPGSVRNYDIGKQEAHELLMLELKTE